MVAMVLQPSAGHMVNPRYHKWSSSLLSRDKPIRAPSRVAALVMFLTLASQCYPEPSCAAAPAAQIATFSARWWFAANSRQRMALLLGVDDCYSVFAKPPRVLDSYLDRTDSDIFRRITAFYNASPSNLSVSAMEALHHNYTPHHDEGYENDRVGSEYWLRASPLERVTYLEGYLSCRKDIGGGARWSRPVQYYVNKLNDMYNVDDRFGENAPEYDGPVIDAMKSLVDP